MVGIAVQKFASRIRCATECPYMTRRRAQESLVKHGAFPILQPHILAVDKISREV